MNIETQAAIYTMEMTIDSLIRARNEVIKVHHEPEHYAVRTGEVIGFDTCIQAMTEALEHIKKEVTK